MVEESGGDLRSPGISNARKENCDHDVTVEARCAAGQQLRCDSNAMRAGAAACPSCGRSENRGDCGALGCGAFIAPSAGDAPATARGTFSPID